MAVTHSFDHHLDEDYREDALIECRSKHNWIGSRNSLVEEHFPSLRDFFFESQLWLLQLLSFIILTFYLATMLVISIILSVRSLSISDFLVLNFRQDEEK